MNEQIKRRVSPEEELEQLQQKLNTILHTNYDRDPVRGLEQLFTLLPACNLLGLIGGALQDLQAHIAALKEAQEQEPIGRISGGYCKGKTIALLDESIAPIGTMLYAKPVTAATAVAVPEFCRQCGGQGVVTVMSDGGPDAYEIDTNCPRCNGDCVEPAKPTDEQIHAAYREALGQSIRERDMPEIRKFARALLKSLGAPQ